MSSCRIHVIIARIKWNLNFLNRVLKSTQILNFMKIRLIGAEILHANRRTDMSKVIAAFGNIANAPKNVHIQQSITSIQQSIPLYKTLGSTLYNNQCHSIQHSIHIYTTLNSSLYKTQFLSIQNSVPLYTTLSYSLHNTQFPSIQHSVPLYKTINISLYNT